MIIFFILKSSYGFIEFEIIVFEIRNSDLLNLFILKTLNFDNCYVLCILCYTEKRYLKFKINKGI